MAGIKISALPAITTSALTDVAPFVQAGVTYKVTNTQLITLYNTNIQLASTSQVTGLNTLLGNYLPLAGGIMTGVIDMGNHKITNVATPTLAQDATNKTYVDAGLALYLPLAGGTMSGVINMNSHKITNVTDPTNAQDAATKNYVDLHGSGITVILAAAAATTANLNATHAGAGVGATLTNAGAMVAFSVDGYAASLNDRILVKNQTLTQHNGVYTVTTVGSGAANWVLTRATDYDTNTEIVPGTLVAVNNGTVNAGTSWIETATVVTVDTDPVLFSQFTFASSSFLQIANNLSDVANKTTSFNNVSPLTTKGDLIGFSANNVRLAVGATDGQILQVLSGAATGLAWSTATYPSASGTVGKILRSDGTNNVYTTATYPATTTINRILYSSAANTVSEIVTANSSILTTNGSGVPSFTASTGFIQTIVSSRITTTGAFTYTPTTGMRYVRVRIIAGGGGSGGVACIAGRSAAACGGNSGGYIEFYMTAVQVGVSLAGNVGAAGIAAAAGANTGGAGGNTIFGDWTALGGQGGLGCTSATTSQVVRSTLESTPNTTGTGTVLVDVPPDRATWAYTSGATIAIPGNGSDSMLGLGGVGAILTSFSSIGGNGSGYGAGGGGSGAVNVVANIAGVVGRDGAVFLEEYIAL